MVLEKAVEELGSDLGLGSSRWYGLRQSEFSKE